MTNKIVMSSLAPGVNSQQIKAFFGEKAPVQEAEVYVDPVTSRSRGLAVVTFPSVTEATLAVNEFNGKELGGRPVSLAFATSEILATVAKP